MLLPRRARLWFFVFMTFAGQAFAQSNDTPKELKEANRAFQSRRFFEAAQLFEEYFSGDNTNFQVAYRIGRCYYYMRQVPQEIEWYTKAMGIDANGSDTLYFDLATALMTNGNYSDAKVQFNAFLERYALDDDFQKQARVRIEGCDFAMNQANQLPDYRITIIEGLNEEGTDFNPAPYIVKGDSFMIFTSHRAPVDKKGRPMKVKRIYQRYNEPYSDLWIAQFVTDSTFDKLEGMGKKINTKANDGTAVVSPDGMTLYYTICGKGKYQKKYGCSIYYSEFNADAKTWGKYQPLEGINGEMEVVVNTRGKTKKVPTSDSHPTLTPDGNTMYFVSNRDGGLGNTDIWYSTKIGNAWSTPVHAGNVINTPFNETSPNIGADGQSIYFASDGHPGFGGYDLFKADGLKGAYENVKNLGKALNSPYNDHSLVWLFQDSIGYIASDRVEGSKGKFDLYRVQFIYRPPLEIVVRGTIRDKDTKEPIPFATAVLYEILVDDNGDTLLSALDTTQTDQTAQYEFTLENEKRYKIVGNAPEYLAGEEYVSTKAFDKDPAGNGGRYEDLKWKFDLRADIDIYLEAINIDAPIVLQNVYFDFDSAAVRYDAKPTLDNLVRVLSNNPAITIQLGAHTDTNGTEKYNKDLANRRAKSVMDYLAANGIASERLSWFGFGETQPLVYPELSDADEQANRRVEFRIKTVDFAPKASK